MQDPIDFIPKNNEKDTIAFTWTLICLFRISSDEKLIAREEYKLNDNSSKFPAKLAKIFCCIFYELAFRVLVIIMCNF